MKKRFLLRVGLLAVTFLMMNRSISAQDNPPTLVGSCYYYYSHSAGSIYETCGYVDSGSIQSTLCPEGKVLACRLNKRCDWECQCMSLDYSVLFAWLSKSKNCDQGGGGGPGNGNGQGQGNHWNWRSAENDDSEERSFHPEIYPNPIADFSNIGFTLGKTQLVKIKLFDVAGRLVANIVDGTFNAGKNEIVWHTTVEYGGVYILQIQSEDLVHAELITIIK